MILLSLIIAALPADAATVSAATRDDRGCFIHTVTSPCQAGETKIRVLLPDRLEEGKRYPVLYVLPVEAKDESRYGDGLLEAKKHDLHNKYGVICVAPTFSHLPWYADHPSDPEIRQETYLLEVVLPFVERTYPARSEPAARLLVGFSKSGWGAWSLLLRHPDVFGRAAAWDAPLLLDKPGRYGSGPIFGTEENFEQYEIVRLLKSRGKSLGEDPRLVLTGYGNFKSHHDRAHALLIENEVPHIYVEGEFRKHDWHSGWLPEAVELLLDRP